MLPSIHAPRTLHLGLLVIAATLAILTAQAGAQAPSALLGAQFGYGMAASENVLAVGARGPGNLPGTVYVFRKQKDRWFPVAALHPKKLVSPRFGANIAVSDQYVLVGHVYEPGGGGADAGVAYAYEILRSGEAVGPGQPLTAAKPEPKKWFGASVGVFGDQLFVGAPLNGAGLTSIFGREGTKWKLLQELAAEGANQAEGARQMFGSEIAADARTLVVGAPYFGPADKREGAGWAYTRDAQGVLQMPPTALRCGEKRAGFMGSSVALSSELIVLGDYRATIDGLENAGRAYVFQRNPDGGFPTTPTAVLSASDFQKKGSFGMEVAVFERTIFVASVHHTSKAGGVDAGGVYIFEPVPGDQPAWKQAAIVEGSGPGAFLGEGLAVSGSQLIVSETRAQNGEGQVHVYAIETPVPAGGLKKLETLKRPAKLNPR